MQLKIKKFSEISDLDVSLPCVVSGDNATGKTTIARAYLYVLGLPDACGKDFVGGGERGIYNRENPDFAEVTLETGDKILTRRSDGKTVRKKGEEVEEFIPVVTNTYFVDGSAVGQVDYAKAVGIEFDFISIENFWRKDQKTQREIISKAMEIFIVESKQQVTVTNAGKQLEIILSELQIKIYSFAAKIGINKQNLYDIRKGKTQKISPTIAKKIVARYPQFKFDWLVSGYGEMYNTQKIGDNSNNNVGNNINNSSVSINETKDFTKNSENYHLLLLKKDEQIREKDKQISDLLAIIKDLTKK